MTILHAICYSKIENNILKNCILVKNSNNHKYHKTANYEKEFSFPVPNIFDCM